jgi:hypothetical protein
MDFHNTNAPGGAPALVATVKAFAGAGVSNRVTACFDNDSAARVALRGLKGVVLPSTMRVITLPPIPLAASYPTLGPHGTMTMDVNGLAGSLELYYGRDVLLDGKGELTPVQWTGYKSEVGRYQGEVMDKLRLQQAFRDKLNRAAVDTSFRDVADWSGIRAVVDAIRKAFEKPQPELW